MSKNPLRSSIAENPKTVFPGSHATRVGSPQARAERFESDELAAYWHGLGSASHRVSRRAAIHMRTREDWLDLEDSQGRTPMMWVAALGRPSECDQFLPLKKARAALQKKDKKGRSIWAYMMAQGRNLEPDDLRALIAATPFEVDPQGRGLIAQTLSVFKPEPDDEFAVRWEKQYKTEAQEDALGINAELIQALADPRLWWGGTAAAQNEIARFIVGGSMRWDGGSAWALPRLAHHVWALGNELPVDGLSPALLGALALAQAAGDPATPLACLDLDGEGDSVALGQLGAKKGLGGGGTETQISQFKKNAVFRCVEAGGVLPPAEGLPHWLRARVWGRQPGPVWMPELLALSERNALREAARNGRPWTGEESSLAETAGARRLRL